MLLKCLLRVKVQRALYLAWIAVGLNAAAPVFAYAHTHLGTGGEVIEASAADEAGGIEAKHDHSHHGKDATPRCLYCPGFSACAALAPCGSGPVGPVDVATALNSSARFSTSLPSVGSSRAIARTPCVLLIDIAQFLSDRRGIDMLEPQRLASDARHNRFGEFDDHSLFADSHRVHRTRSCFIHCQCSLCCRSAIFPGYAKPLTIRVLPTSCRCPPFRSVKNGDDPSTRQTDIAVEFSKRVTDSFGVSIGTAWSQLAPASASHINGFQNLEASLKYQFLTAPARELVMSGALVVEFGAHGKWKRRGRMLSTCTHRHSTSGQGFGGLSRRCAHWRDHSRLPAKSATRYQANRRKARLTRIVETRRRN